MARARWTRGGGPVCAGAVAVALTLAGCSGGGGASSDPSSDPSSTASANPALSASPAAAPSPAPSGFLPVDSLGASAIPWDEVGPGWVLIRWSSEHGWWTAPVAYISDGLTLWAPDGTLYTGRTVEGANATNVMGWFSGGVGLFDVTPGKTESELACGSEPGYCVLDGYPFVDGDSALLDLRTGDVASLLAGARFPVWSVETSAGALVGFPSEGGGTEVLSYSGAGVLREVCAGSVTSSISPTGRDVVCLKSRGDGSTDVVLGDVVSGSSVAIDVFQRNPEQYAIAGWLDDHTFLLRRGMESGTEVATFAYDISTRKIRDFQLPPALAAIGYVDYDAVTGVWIELGYSESKRFWDSSGNLLADVPCADSPWTASFTGTYALLNCGAPAHDSSVAASVVRVDLSDGSIDRIDVTVGASQLLWAYGYSPR